MSKSIVIFLIGISVIAVFSGMFYSPRTLKTLVCCDEFEYTTIAQNVAAGNGYSIQTHPPYIPTLLREPGYPLLLSAVFTVVKSDPLVVAQYINLLLLLGSAFLLWLIARTFLSVRAAVAAALFFLFSPRMLYYSATILSDSLSVLFFLLSILFLLNGMRAPTLKRALLAGISVGLLSLTKMAFVFYLPALLLYWGVGEWIYQNAPVSGRTAYLTSFPIRYGMTALLGFAIVLSPWLVRNIILFHSPTITVRTGQLLNERVRYYTPIHSIHDVALFYARDILPGAAPLKGAVREPDIIAPYGVVYGQPHLNAPATFFSLLSKGLSEREADRQMVQDGVRMIAEHPFLYITQIPIETIKFYYPEFLPGISGQISSLPGWQSIVIILLLGVLSAIFFGCVLSGFKRLIRNKDQQSWLVLATILYASGVHILLYVTPRYGLIIYPLLILVALIGIHDGALLQMKLYLKMAVTRIFWPATLILGLLNLHFTITVPVIAWISNRLSTGAMCVSCTPLHFILLDLAFSILLIVSGIVGIIVQQYPTLASHIVHMHSRLILRLFILLCILLTALASANRLIAIDEIEHIHSSWHILVGHHPYRDFFEQHHPLLWYILAPLLSLTGTNSESIIMVRFLMFFMTIGTFGALFLLGRMIFGETVGLMSVFFASQFILFLDSMIEVRPDTPQTFFQLLALILFLQYYRHQKKTDVILAGLAMAIAFLFIQKALVLFVILAALLSFKPPSEQPRIFSVLLFAFSMSVILIPYYSFLLSTGAFRSYWEDAWLVNLFLSGRSNLIQAISLTLIENTLTWVFAIIGLFFVRTMEKTSQQLFLRITLLVFISLLIFKFPAKQYFAFSFALTSILAAVGFESLCQRFKWSMSRQLLLAIATSIIPIFFLIENAIPNNRLMLKKIQFILDATPADAIVFDPSVQLNPFRPDMHYVWYAVQPLLKTYNKFSPMEYDACALIREKRPRIIVNDGLVAICHLPEQGYVPTIYPEIFRLPTPVRKQR